MREQWKEGVFGHIFKKFSKKLTFLDSESITRHVCEVEKLMHKWIVLDGPIDPLWFESMNTLLDDSQVLTLTNGIRINNVDNVKLLFETSELTNMSVPSISRLAIINFPQSSSYISNKIKKFTDNFNFNEHVKDQIQILVKEVLNPILVEFDNFDKGIPMNKSEFIHSFLYQFMEGTSRCKFDFEANIDDMLAEKVTEYNETLEKHF